MTLKQASLPYTLGLVLALGLLGVGAALGADTPLPDLTQPQLSLNLGGLVGSSTGPRSLMDLNFGGETAGLEWRPSFIPQQVLALDAGYEHDVLVQGVDSATDNDLDLALRLMPFTFGKVSLTLLGGSGYNISPNTYHGKWLAFVEPDVRYIVAPRLAMDFGLRFMLNTPETNMAQSMAATVGVTIPLSGSFVGDQATETGLPMEEDSAQAPKKLKYPPFLIGPGDTVNVTVFGEHDLSSGTGQQAGGGSTFVVDSDGSIVYPLVGEISLGGLSQAQASHKLSHALSRYMVNPQVTVSVTNSAQYTVSVMGNVSKPGTYLIRGLPTLVGALALAGGPATGSNLDGVVLIRRNLAYHVPLATYLEPSMQAKPEPIIYPGDVIYVPSSAWPDVGEWGVIASIVSSLAFLLATAHL